MKECMIVYKNDSWRLCKKLLFC